jgi:DNA-directed RNA polymerase specialized sigma24 family protein
MGASPRLVRSLYRVASTWMATLANLALERGADVTDTELLRRIGEGDLRPLGILYDRHHESVRQFVRRVTGGGADADDIVHEAFLTLVSIADRYDGRDSARPLLLGIAVLLVEREGLSGEEVASALKLPLNTVWTRLHYARAELRRAISAHRAV